MYGLSEEAWNSWCRKRRNTVIGYIIVGTAIGIDCSVVFTTLYYYLRDVIRTDQPQMWYGVITASFYISSAILGTICGRWIDKTRNARVYVNVTLIVQVIGFLLYSIPYHPVFLLVGRAICGIGQPFVSVISGELFRIHDQQGSTRAMLLLASVYSFGTIIGPLFNFLFKEVRFHIGPIEINYSNCIGIFMVTVMSVLLLVVNFLVHNCSLELDIKEYLHNETRNKISHDAEATSVCNVDIQNNSKICDDKNNAMIFSNRNAQSFPFSSESIPQNILMSDEPTEETIDPLKGSMEETVNIGTSDELSSPIDIQTPTYDCPEGAAKESMPVSVNYNCNLSLSDPSEHNTSRKDSRDSSTPRVTVVLKALVSNKEILLIFISTFVFMYSMIASYGVIFLLVPVTLHWSLNSLSTILVGFGIAYFAVLSLMGKFCKTKRAIFIFSILSIVSQILGCCVLICFKVLQRDYARDVTLMVVYLICLVFGWCFDDVLVRVLFANLVPSKIQSFSEALRSGICKVGMIAGSFSIGVMIPWLQWWSCVIISLMTLILAAFVTRAKYLINPQQISFS